LAVITARNDQAGPSCQPATFLLFVLCLRIAVIFARILTVSAERTVKLSNIAASVLVGRKLG
jgi:hypothetical protein